MAAKYAEYLKAQAFGSEKTFFDDNFIEANAIDNGVDYGEGSDARLEFQFNLMQQHLDMTLFETDRGGSGELDSTQHTTIMTLALVEIGLSLGADQLDAPMKLAERGNPGSGEEIFNKA